DVGPLDAVPLDVLLDGLVHDAAAHGRDVARLLGPVAQPAAQRVDRALLAARLLVLDGELGRVLEDLTDFLLPAARPDDRALHGPEGSVHDVRHLPRVQVIGDAAQ